VQRLDEPDRVVLTESVVSEGVDAGAHAGNLANGLTYRFSLLLTIDMMKRPRWSPVPFLLRGFLRLLVLTTPLFVFFGLLAATGERRVTWVDQRWSSEGEAPGVAQQAEPGTSLAVEGHVKYVVDEASPWLWIVSLLPGLLLALAVSTVALLLLRMMRETYAGRPFSASGARRLRRVAAVVAGAAVLVPMLQAVSAHAIATQVLPSEAPGLLDRWDLLSGTVPWLVVALLVLAVAEAFGIGARLADDVDGLV
jgi:hypothetical protein